MDIGSIEGVRAGFPADRMEPEDRTPGTRGNPRLERAAEDFEALLLKSWWKAMKTTFADEEEAAGSSGFGDMGVEAMSNAIAANGGLGLARLFLAELTRRPAPEASPAVDAGAAGTPERMRRSIEGAS